MSKTAKKIRTGICVLLTAGIVTAPFAYAVNIARSADLVSGGSIELPVKYTNYDEIISQAEQTKAEYEQKAAQTQAQIDSLNREYDSIVAYINELDAKQADIAIELSQIEVKLAYLESEKEDTEVKLAEATEEMENQYDTMSARVKYVYENGETSYYDILFNSGSIADILNRVEYVSQISKYDDQLFTNYAESVRVVSEYNDSLDHQLAAIDEVNTAYNKYYELAEELIDAKNAALEECAAKRGVALDVYAQYMNEIESQQMTIDQAVAAKAEEEERQRQAAIEAARIQAELERQLAQQAYQVKSTGVTSVAGITKTDISSITSMIWPMPGSAMITSGFGPRTSPTAGASSYHRGIDIGAPYGAPIVAAAAGTVVTAGTGWAEGNYVVIDHGTHRTVYMHASALAVTAGTYVQQGQVIAYVGATGVATGPHLHFGVQINGTYVSPLLYVHY